MVALRARALLLDTAIAAVVFALTLAMVASGRFDDSDAAANNLDALGFVLALLASVPLAARRVAPLAVFGLTTAATALLYAFDYSLGPPLGLAVALYTVAASRDELRGGKRLTPIVVASLFVPFMLVSQHDFPFGPEVLLGGLVWLTAWFAGDRTRLRRERIAALEERALRAERETERERRLAVAEERTRIARDLHDSAGHAINVILVQTGAARLLRDRDPERSREALETVEEVARETLGEIDQLVRGLREDGSDEVEPPPGLAALDALAERHRASGHTIRTEITGSRRPLAPRVDRAAYRILQEALTNATRHGHGATEVSVIFGADDLELTVENPTRANQAIGSDGHGLVGMRERAALLGGTLEAGAAAGAFRVRARLPYAVSGEPAR
jgi:signal transduction histidine kinase